MLTNEICYRLRHRGHPQPLLDQRGDVIGRQGIESKVLGIGCLAEALVLRDGLCRRTQREHQEHADSEAAPERSLEPAERELLQGMVDEGVVEAEVGPGGLQAVEVGHRQHHVRPGQHATISVDAHPGLVLRARVDSIQSGTGSRFSLLPPENASGNFVKVVQRIPVKLVLEPGQHGQATARRRKASEFSKQLREKQKIKRIYGVSEKQFRNTFEKVSAQPGLRGHNLLAALETRLDNVVYRLGFAGSRAQARQLVRHGHFHVNGRRVNIPSYGVKPNDTISLGAHSRGAATKWSGSLAVRAVIAARFRPLMIRRRVRRFEMALRHQRLPVEPLRPDRHYDVRMDAVVGEIDGDAACRLDPGGVDAHVWQPLLGERSEHLATSDRGVIMLRKMMRQAIETTMRGRRPKGVLTKEEAERIIDFGCFTGVKPKGQS